MNIHSQVPIKLQIKLERKFNTTLWMKVPCIDNIGSCSFNNVYDEPGMLLSGGEFETPPMCAIPSKNIWKAYDHLYRSGVTLDSFLNAYIFSYENIPLSSRTFPGVIENTAIQPGDYRIEYVYSSGDTTLFALRFSFNITVNGGNESTTVKLIQGDEDQTLYSTNCQEAIYDLRINTSTNSLSYKLKYPSNEYSSSDNQVLWLAFGNIPWRGYFNFYAANSLQAHPAQIAFFERKMMGLSVLVVDDLLTVFSDIYPHTGLTVTNPTPHWYYTSETPLNYKNYREIKYIKYNNQNVEYVNLDGTNYCIDSWNY